MQHPPALPARDPRVEIVYRAIDQLKPDPRNPRRHERKQIRKIADSIAAFGFNVPILVDADLKVIAGHGRLLACRLLSRNEVPTISLEHLSVAQARAFMIVRMNPFRSYLSLIISCARASSSSGFDGGLVERMSSIGSTRPRPMK